MKLKKELYKYSKDELEIFNKFFNNFDTYDKINTLNIEKKYNKEDFNFLIDNIESIDNIYIKNNDFIDLFISSEKLNVTNNITIKNGIIDNDIFNKLLEIYNNIEWIDFEYCQLNIDIIDFKHIKQFIIENCNIDKLNKIIGENIESIEIMHEDDYKLIEFDNGYNEFKHFASVGVELKPLNKIPYVKELYYELFNNENIIIDNIDKIDELIIHKVNSKLIDVSRVECNNIEISDCQIGTLLLNSNLDTSKIYEISGKIDKINLPITYYKSSFKKYYKEQLNNVKNNNINDIERFKILKYLKKYHSKYCSKSNLEFINRYS